MRISPERAAEAVALACPPGSPAHPVHRRGAPAALGHGGEGAGLRPGLRTEVPRRHPDQRHAAHTGALPGAEARRVAVGVSLDGVGPDNAARRTPEGEPSFQATARGLQTLAAVSMAANLTAVVSAGSVRGLDRLLDFALWCGNVHGVGLDLVRPQGRGAGRAVPLPQALAEGLNRLLARHDQLARLGRPVRLKELERLRLLLRTGCRRDCYCNAQTGRSLAVTPDGTVALLRPGRGGGVPPGYAGRGDGPAAESLPRAGTAGGMRPLSRLRPVRRGCPAARRAGPSPGLPDAPEDAGARLLTGGEIEWWNTWKTAFPDREEPDDKEESQ
ncbi:radical SAM protein [Flavonifractor plautii]|nr:radical SAM protein [Flavonifractor plautii]